MSHCRCPFGDRGLISLARPPAPLKRSEPLWRHKSAERPDRHSPNYRRGALELFNGHLGKGRIAAVACGDEAIAHEPLKANPLNRAARKQRPEGGFIKAKEGCEPGSTKAVARLQFGLTRLRREFVPGADGKAVVAAKDPVAHKGPQLAADVALMLDRQIRDAPAGIEDIRARESPRRAHVEAFAAAPAMILPGRVGRKLKGGEDRS